MSSSPLTPLATRPQFNLSLVLDALVEAKLITKKQSVEIAAKETQARARVIKATGGSSSYVVSPIETVAVFQLPLPGRPSETVDQDRISEAVARKVGLGYRKIDLLKLDYALATRVISKPFAQKNVILPLEAPNVGTLVVAVANPLDEHLFDNLKGLTGKTIVPVLTAKADILRGLNEVYGFKRTLAAAAVDFQDASPGIASFEQLVQISSGQELAAEDKPIIQAVDYLFRSAFDNRASDIHIEPKRETSVVRFRIDGVLHPVQQMPGQLHAPIISRLKTIARIDISEKRKPQDGRIKIERDGREVEIRVSTLPTAFGEKVVLRIFDPETLVTDIARLGFDPEEKGIFEGWIAQPHGLILVTGPTGSGKTTTLYSALKALAGPDVNVTTIEDPIEMVWEPFNQTQVQPKIGLDFANALRHILRQDPDIVMVGEIRDPETADNAIQASLTGHLVLSTLHTNDAVGAVGRLKDLQVPPFLLSSSLTGVMAQRLLRKVCAACSEPIDLKPDEVAALGVPLPLLAEGPKFLKGKGCIKCRGTGYQGRTGVFEIFSATPEVRELINQGATTERLIAGARKAGMRTLREAAVLKLVQGLTSYEEVLRMTGAW